MRVTKQLVRDTWATFADLANRVGFDTEPWRLQEGDRFRNWAHFERFGRGLGEGEFRAHLGATTAEAYATLTARIHTLQAVLELQRQQAVKAQNKE